MLRSILTMTAALACTAAAGAQVAVHVEPYHLEGPRTLEQQTATAVVRDYIESWKSLHTALDENSVAALNRDFVGDAKDKLAQTVAEQQKAGIRTSYQDQSHDVQIVFYSPEGLSIELTDTVEYDEQILDHDKAVTTQHVTAHYIVVLTPAEVRWRVRVLQAIPE